MEEPRERIEVRSRPREPARLTTLMAMAAILRAGANVRDLGQHPLPPRRPSGGGHPETYKKRPRPKRQKKRKGKR